MTRDVFGYELIVIYLEKRDFIDFLDRKEITASCIGMYMK